MSGTDDSLESWTRLIDHPAEDSDSFELHAPLEITARHALMAHADPSAWRLYAAQQQATVARYRARVPSAGQPRRSVNAAPEVLVRQLAAQLDEGDLDASAQTTRSLAAQCDHIELCRTLLPMVDSSLMAAGHAPILFHRLLHMDHASASLASRMLAATVPEFARGREQINWQQPVTTAPDRSLIDWLARIVAPPDHQVAFGIIALIRSAEGSAVLNGCPIGRAESTSEAQIDAIGRATCRSAAWSMLEEDESQSKYGWSHALTLPQANWSLARLGVMDKPVAVRNAIAFAAAFRHSNGKHALDMNAPENPHTPLKAALPEDSRLAAHAAWHAEDAADVWHTLASAAVIRSDAHLVKHTLSAMEMAAVDRTHAGLYRAAAARLVSIWVQEQPDASIQATLQQRE